MVAELSGRTKQNQHPNVGLNVPVSACLFSALNQTTKPASCSQLGCLCALTTPCQFSLGIFNWLSEPQHETEFTVAGGQATGWWDAKPSAHTAGEGAAEGVRPLPGRGFQWQGDGPFGESSGGTPKECKGGGKPKRQGRVWFETDHLQSAADQSIQTSHFHQE